MPRQKRIPGISVLVCVLCTLSVPIFETGAQTARTRALPDPYYPQKPTGELRLNYYYDRTGRWVKFSDWIPFKQKKYAPRFFEDFYLLYGLPHHYKAAEVKEGIFFLYMALSSRFRHPRRALCKIRTEPEYHKYRLMMFMKVNLLIMRMYLRLGSLYDKRHLYFHDLDFADDLEVSFLVARTYYREARKYWKLARKYAQGASEYPFLLNIPNIESDRHKIIRGDLNYERIIGLHLARVDAKLGIAGEFLKREGRPRPVKVRMNDYIKKTYDKKFTPFPLKSPQLDAEWKETPLFPWKKSLFPAKK